MIFNRSIKRKAECVPNRLFDGEWEGRVLLFLSLMGNLYALCVPALLHIFKYVIWEGIMIKKQKGQIEWQMMKCGKILHT